MDAEQICNILQNTPEPALDQVMEALKDFINIKDAAGYTPLNWACRKQFNSLALKLIKKNVDVNTVADDANTPLIWACYHKMEDVALALVEKNANVNAVDSIKNTPLTWACFGSMETLALALIEKNADINAKNSTQDTPFAIACARSLEKVAFKLLAKNADITVQKNDGRTGKDYIKKNWSEDAKRRILYNIELRNKPVVQSETSATNTPEATQSSVKPKQYPCDMSLTGYFNQNNVPYKVENKIITLL